MRTVRLGEHEIELRATPLALFFYKQAFGRDLIGDISSFQSMSQTLNDGDFSQFDSVLLLQLAYAMNKASKPGKTFPMFEAWLNELDAVAFDDPEWMVGIVEEAVDGFFRTARAAAEKQGRPKKSKSKSKA